MKGQPVAIAEARSTYFHELESAIAFKRLNFNEIDSARSFQRTMRDINFAFNWFYADDRDIAWTLSGWYPRRAEGNASRLPGLGHGRVGLAGLRQLRLQLEAHLGHEAAAVAEPGAGLPRQLEQQAGAGLARGRRLLELRLDPADDAARGPGAARHPRAPQARPGGADARDGAGRHDRPARLGALPLAAPGDRPREQRRDARGDRAARRAGSATGRTGATSTATT